MLFLLFRLGEARYALEARRLAEVLPLIGLKPLPGSPAGVAGVMNLRGAPLPVLDLSALALRRPAQRLLSTRIMVVRDDAVDGTLRLLGLIAEQATETVRRDPGEFCAAGIDNPTTPYLGPVLPDPLGLIQWIEPRRLLPDSVASMLFLRVEEAT